jgi:hypothetical protein
MTRIPPDQEISVSEMSGTQLYNYRRALVRHLRDRRCGTDNPRYQEQRNRLAEVLAEEQARRKDHDGAVTVQRLRF